MQSQIWQLLFPFSFLSFSFLSFFSFVSFLFFSFLSFYFLSFLSFPFCSSSTNLSHFLHLIEFSFLLFFFSFSILVTQGFYVSPSHPFHLPMWHKGAMHLAMWHFPPTWHLIYGHDVMWHPATCYLVIHLFHLEVCEISTISEFDEICLGN